MKSHFQHENLNWRNVKLYANLTNFSEESELLFMNESYRFRNLWTCNTVNIWLRRSSSLSRLVVKKLWNHTKAAGSPLNFKGKHSRMQDVYRCKALVKMPQKFNKETRFEYENHSWRKGATKRVFLTRNHVFLFMIY